MKRLTGTVERFSPDWIRMIPRWLARGIWTAIEDGIEGGEHAGTREQKRRRSQIDRGILRDSNRGATYACDDALIRRDERRRDRAAKVAELQSARLEATLTKHADRDVLSAEDGPDVPVARERGDVS